MVSFIATAQIENKPQVITLSGISLYVNEEIFSTIYKGKMDSLFQFDWQENDCLANKHKDRMDVDLPNRKLHQSNVFHRFAGVAKMCTECGDKL